MREIILAPEWATKPLQKFGTNPFGAPRFRVIWGPSATKIVGGFWLDKGKSEYRLTPRYGFDPKWILERWQPACEIGSPSQWDAMTITPDGFYSIGPFPSHGRYLHCTTFSTAKGFAGYVPLEPGMVELAARLVWIGRTVTPWEISVEMRGAEEAKLRQEDANFDAMWDEKQLSRQGLSIGAGGAFDKQKEIDDYARRIQRSQAYVSARKFRPGFKQHEEN